MLYEFKIKTLTPLTVAVKEGFKGLLYKALKEHIPGSTVKGSILSKIIREYGVSKLVNNEVHDPQISITQALACPSMDYTLIENVLPTHPLCYRWKTEKRIETLNLGDLLTEFKKSKDVKRAFSNILDKVTKLHLDYFKTRAILRSTGEMVSKPFIAVKRNGVWEKITVHTSTYIQVGIEKISRRASPGLIYGYEYVKPGQCYTGFIAGKRVENIAKMLGETSELKIGRGISRGFGTVLFELREVDVEKFFEEKLSKIVDLDCLKKEEPLCLYALSPLVTEPLGEVLNANIKGSLELPTNWLSKNIGELNAKIKLEVYGALSFGTELYRGFSLRTTTPKITVKSLAKGTLLLCEIKEVSGTSSNLEKLLTYTVFYGLDFFSTQGYNHVIPLTKDPFLT